MSEAEAYRDLAANADTEEEHLHYTRLAMQAEGAPGLSQQTPYFEIGFVADASETAESFIDQIKDYFVRVTTTKGEQFDCYVEGVVGIWDGENGVPLIIRHHVEGDPVGEPVAIDAVKVLVY